MSAVVIPLRPIVLPTYRNAHVSRFSDWYRDNEPKLIEYYAALALYVEKPDPADYEEFVACQWDRARLAEGIQI